MSQITKISNDMALIPLTSGDNAIIDDDMVDFVSQWKFHKTTKGHVRTCIVKDGKIFFIGLHFCLMHRDLGSKSAIEEYRLKVKEMKPMPIIDHINRNKLDNRLINLRHATIQQNGMNISKRPGLSSRFLGVSAGGTKTRKRWQAKLKVNGAYVFHKDFPFTAEGEIAAAQERDLAAIKFHGEFASLNFPELKNTVT